MNYKNLFYFPLFAIAVMSSCSNDNEMNSTNSEYVNSVRVTVEDFQPETTTRTAYTVDGSGFHFQWVDGDALGIYPVGGDQVKFPISSGDGSASASFDGGAWKLRSEYQYAAYYPFSADNYKIDQTALPVSFTGQTQNGNGSTAHLSAYDYLACAATAPDANGGVDLTMKHLGAFLRLQLTMPKADTYSSVTLESDGTKFVTAGTFDLTAATPAITPTATSSTYTINLNNVSTTEEKQVVTVYAIVAPANLSSSNITVTVHGAGQATYVQTVSGKNFAARSAYNIAIESFPSGTNASGEDVNWDAPANIENGHEWVDLGLSVKWATCNVGAENPEEYGTYFAWGEVTGCQYNNGSLAPAIMDGYPTTWTRAKNSNYIAGEEKTGFEGTNYKWCTGTWNQLIKYNTWSTFGITDSRYSLEAEDDAATVNWGGNWRTPTNSEQSELKNQCYWVWTSNYDNSGIAGYIVYKAKSDSDKGKKVYQTGTPSANYSLNDNHIFLPTAGNAGTSLRNIGSLANYWSKTLCYSSDTSGCINAYVLSCDNISVISSGESYRYGGLPVRAVCP